MMRQLPKRYVLLFALANAAIVLSDAMSQSTFLFS